MGFQGGAVRVKQDFTDNKPQLLEVVQTLVFGEDKDGEIYVCDHNRGVIYRVEAVAAPQQAARGE